MDTSVEEPLKRKGQETWMVIGQILCLSHSKRNFLSFASLKIPTSARGDTSRTSLHPGLPLRALCV